MALIVHGKDATSGAPRYAASSEALKDEQGNTLVASPGGLQIAAAIGLLPRWASSTTAVVGTGRCRDGQNSGEIILTAEVTADITTVHSASDGLATLNGIDEKGLDNLAVSPITASQTTKTITATANITSHLQGRAISGTSSSTGTAVTGTSTKFLSEVSVNDVFGNATNGWSRVTAIASDLALTLSSSIPGGNLSGASITVSENVTIQCGTATKTRVDTINAAGTTIVVEDNGTQAALSALTIGVEHADCWYAVWVVDNGATPGVLLSTQRTTLYAPPTGYTKTRRVGWMRNNASGNLIEVYYYDLGGGGRRAVYETNLLTAVLSLGTATTWTAVLAHAYGPPTARQLDVRAYCDPLTADATHEAYLRQRNAGASGVSRNTQVKTENGSTLDFVDNLLLGCDGAQALDYAVNTTNNRLSLTPFAWYEAL